MVTVGDTSGVIQVGVAYDSNVFHAMKLMEDAARAHPNVFDDAGIMVALPQRDLHLDTRAPLATRVQQP